MAKPVLPVTPRPKVSRSKESRVNPHGRKRRSRRSKENTDVLISAVISSDLLTNLHQTLQKAEYLAVQEGKQSHAVNFAQLRKVLCMDARSMDDASAVGIREGEIEKTFDSKRESKAA